MLMEGYANVCLTLGMGILQETGKDTFALGPVAGAYVLASPLASAVIHMSAMTISST